MTRTSSSSEPGLTGLADIDALLASWERDSAGTSFGLAKGATRELRFAFALPDDPVQAMQRLHEQGEASRRSQALLADLEARLPQRIGAARASLAFGHGRGDASPEQALLAVLRGPSDLFPGSAESNDDSSTAGEDDDGGALHQVQLLLARVQDFVSHFARIETATGPQTWASTRVGWTGDLLTTWASGVSDEQRALHLQAVRTNLATRLALVRLVSLIVAGAAALAVQWALPGGALRALPTAWRLARELIAEAKRLGSASLPDRPPT